MYNLTFASQNYIKKLFFIKVFLIFDQIFQKLCSLLVHWHFKTSFCHNENCFRFYNKSIVYHFNPCSKQAEELFGQSENIVEEDDKTFEEFDHEKIIPNLIVSLVAADDFIKNKVMRLSEKSIQVEYLSIVK